MYEHNEFMKNNNRMWKVSFTNQRVEDSRYYNSSQQVNVIAVTVEEAIKKVHAKYERAKILSVSHQGEITIE